MNFDEILERIKKATGARTQVELANILAIRQSSISDAKRRNSVPSDWYLKLYRSHGLNPDWLAEGVEPMFLKPGMAEAASYVQTVGENATSYGKSASRGRVVSVSSMTGIVGEDDAWKPDFVSQLNIPETFYKPAILVIRVDGSGMEPIVRRGAYLGIDSEQKRIRSGELYGLHMPHEGLVLKRIFYDANNNRFILRSENADHPEQSLSLDKADAHVVGRVVWVLQDM